MAAPPSARRRPRYAGWARRRTARNRTSEARHAAPGPGDPESRCLGAGLGQMVARLRMHYVAGLALVAAAGSAQALDFTITYSGNEQIAVTTVGYGAIAGSYTGGAFTITPTAGVWPSNVSGSFESYCTQMSEYFHGGSGSSQIGYGITSVANPLNQPPVDAAKLDQLSRLMAFSCSGAGFGSGPTNTQEAAVQAAVWEILYEPNGGNWGPVQSGCGLVLGDSYAYPVDRVQQDFDLGHSGRHYQRLVYTVPAVDEGRVAGRPRPGSRARGLRACARRFWRGWLCNAAPPRFAVGSLIRQAPAAWPRGA